MRLRLPGVRRNACTPRPPCLTLILLGEITMPEANALLKMVTTRLDQEKFRQQHWEGTFSEYLDIVSKNARVARNAFQRVYDMILSYGFEKYTLLKADIIKYHFFSDPIDHGADAVFGL